MRLLGEIDANHFFKEGYFLSFLQEKCIQNQWTYLNYKMVFFSAISC